jgi:hypothetical protein
VVPPEEMRTSKIAVLQSRKAAKDIGKRRDKDLLQEDAIFGPVRTLSEKDILRPSVNFISNGGPLIKEKSGEKRLKDKAAENSEAIYVTPAEATTVRPLAASTVQPQSTLSTTTTISTTARPTTTSVITTTTPAAATTGSTVNSAWPMFPLLWPNNAIPVNTHTNTRWQNPPAQPHAFSGQPSTWLLPQQPTAAPAHQQQHQFVHFPLLFLPSMLRASTSLFFPPAGGQQAAAVAARPSSTFMLPVQRAQPSPAAWGGFLQPQNAFRPPIHPLHNYFFLP